MTWDRRSPQQLYPRGGPAAIALTGESSGKPHNNATESRRSPARQGCGCGLSLSYLHSSSYKLNRFCNRLTDIKWIGMATTGRRSGPLKGYVVNSTSHTPHSLQNSSDRHHGVALRVPFNLLNKRDNYCRATVPAAPSQSCHVVQFYPNCA